MPNTLFGFLPGQENPQAITVEDGIITAIEPVSEQGASTHIATASSHSDHDDYLTWVPGFVDLHNHGGNKGAFHTGTVEDCERAANFHLAHGTTTLLASLVSGTRDELCSQSELLAGLAERGLIHGIHMEGPFISACRCGAQDPSRITEGDPEFFADVIEAARGHLRSITFAPETDNATELMKLCAKHNIIASLGHTDADFATTLAMVEYGRRLGATVTATHLFNAMPQIHHRDPGAAAALITAGRAQLAHVELVADGVHLDDGTVDMVAGLGAFAVTDAVEAAGMPDGMYRLGQLDVIVIDGVARITDEAGKPAAIAGGTSTLAQQFSRFASRHSLEEAVEFTSTVAADVAGLGLRRGRIDVGFDADLVGLDRTLTPVRVLRHVEEVATR